MVKIQSIQALEVLDARGVPAIAVEVWLDDGSFGLANVPSGSSTGQYEMAELRDGDSKRYGGKGVLTAVHNINKIIAPSLVGQDALSQDNIDQLLIELDGSSNKSNLGANAMLGVSAAVAWAAAKSSGKQLYEYLSQEKTFSIPVPMIDIINGSAHADNSLDIQGIMLVPHTKRPYHESIRMCAEIGYSLGELLGDDGYQITVGDEGGYAPRLETLELAFEFVMRAVERSGFELGSDVSFALDVAASEIIEYREEGILYHFARSSGRYYSTAELIALYEEWLGKYPIMSIEDGLGENDWEGWQELTSRLGDKVLLIGDDLFVTNTSRIAQGIETKVANGVLIKPNQVGTLTEAREAMELAKQANYYNIVSHRSGETCDSTIADFAVAHGANFLKAGALCRGERIAKYNRLLFIEKQLGDRVSYMSWPGANLRG
ncbi:MAG: phosphopyruvate hydratase [Deltaproteobacteria bacterium]|nr:phosphopyruvate hydratase [Deltaproteobacteria bacterium]